MKKLFAILMSVLMIACFMPTMAFAGETEKGTEQNPYTLADLGNMDRQAYIDAQKTLGGTMYVEVGDYHSIALMARLATVNEMTLLVRHLITVN